MKNFRRSVSIGLITAAVATLSACGGGGGSGAAATSTSVSGVAATGLAISGGQVTLKCAAGSTPTVTTNADGSYTIDVSTVTLPCIARVTYTDSTGQHTLHSLAKASGTVNITPFTDMVVANLSSTGTAAATFDNFKASEVESYTEARVQTATQLVKTKLTTEGVDPAKLPTDLIGTHLEATHDSTMGDRQDQALDELHKQMTQQSKTLEAVESEMHDGRESSLSTSTGTTGDASAGQTAYAANCASCHGARIADAANAANILEAIRENQGSMGTLAGTVTTAMANNIATYMASMMNNTGMVKTSQLISFTSPGNQTMGVATPALTATTTGVGLTVSIQSDTTPVCTVSGTTLTLVAPGSCQLSATQAGNATYSAAPPVSVSFTVLSAAGTALSSQTITFTSLGAQTVGTTASLTASASSGLTVSFASTTPSVCTVSGTTLTPVAAGTCTITADQGGNATYAAAATATQNVTVTAAATGTASATNGKTLYASNSCGSCHGATPTGTVLNGANNPTLIRSFINSNSGGMIKYASLTDAQLADIAAYLATPTI